MMSSWNSSSAAADACGADGRGTGIGLPGSRRGRLTRRAPPGTFKDIDPAVNGQPHPLSRGSRMDEFPNDGGRYDAAIATALLAARGVAQATDLAEDVHARIARPRWRRRGEPAR